MTPSVPQPLESGTHPQPIAEAVQSAAASTAVVDVALFIAISVWMLWGIGRYDLYEPHEAQYAGGAAEMVLRNDWVTPYLNGAPELNKTPLFYWLIASSFWLFGHSGLAPEFIARLPLALVALFGLVLAWKWARELWGPLAGRAAGLMLAVSAGWYLFSHQLLIDELLGILVLASLYVLWKAICHRQALELWAVFYALIGLGVLAKGLLGFIFPLAPLAIYVLIRRDWRLLWQARPFMGMAIVALVVGPWAYLFESHNPGALSYIIINEHLKRAMDTRVPRDYACVQVSVGEYLGLALVWCTPWFFLVPVVAQFAYKSSRRTENSSEQHRKDGILLLGLGAALPVAFFTLFSSRLVYYSLPALPPFMVLCGGFWSSTKTWTTNIKRYMGIITVLCGLALAVALFFLRSWLSGISDLATNPAIMNEILIIAALLAGGFLLCGIFILADKRWVAIAGMLVFMAAAEVVSVTAFGALNSVFSAKRLVEQLAPAVGKECIWVSEGSSEVGASSGLTFYLRHHDAANSSEVKIMSDDTRRPPPSYPGVTPQYLIDHKELATLWSSDKPVLFVTDFQRTDFVNDKPMLPQTDCNLVPIPDSTTGHRRVYANTLALNRLIAAGVIPKSAN
jgi:4-amino-4-deoxy-L-arabinose transferase-like glycosyltransferase